LNPANVTAGNISPLHILGIVDPTASWFSQWMVSHHGRSHLINNLKKTTLLKNTATTFLDYATCLPLAGSISKMMSDELVVMDADNVEEIDNPYLIKHKDLEYVEFLYTINILVQLLICKKGRECFPIYFDRVPMLLKQANLLKKNTSSNGPNTSNPGGNISDNSEKENSTKHLNQEGIVFMSSKWPFCNLSFEALTN
jgi:uncharacterized protein YbaR (Trm112 family)